MSVIEFLYVKLIKNNSEFLKWSYLWGFHCTHVSTSECLIVTIMDNFVVVFFVF